MNENWKLTIKLESPHGDVQFIRGCPVDHMLIGERITMPPPDPLRIYRPGASAMTETVELLKRRHAQPEEMARLVAHLARALGEDIQDWVGWHGERRKEAKRERFGGPKY